MKVVLVIERGALLLWGQIMTRDDGARRSHPKWENHWKNTLKEKDLRFAVNLWTIEALMKKDVPHRRSSQKKSKKWHRSRSKKNKKKKHQRYSSSPSPWSSSNDDSDESKYRNIGGKESTDYRFRVVSDEDQCNYLQIWPNTPTLILILLSKRQT